MPLVLIGFLAGWGCSNDLPKQSRIDQVRVLGVSVDQPEVGPGATVHIQALVVGAPEGEITYSWRACLLSEQGRGVFAGGTEAGASGGNSYSLKNVGTCHELEALDPGAVIDLGDGDAATLELPDHLLDDEVVKQAYGLGKFPLPEVMLLGLKMVAGVNYTVSLRVQHGDTIIDAFKRINVSLDPEPNENPSNLAFALRAGEEASDGPGTGEAVAPGDCLVAQAALGKGAFTLRPLNIPDPALPYQVIAGTTDPAKPFDLLDTEETLFYSFFSTQGEFSTHVTPSTGRGEVVWRFEETPREPVPLWIVVRDGRGGTAWCHSTLQPTTE